MEEENKRPRIDHIDLIDFLDGYLREDDYRPLNKFSHLAEVISIKLGNTLLFKVVGYPNSDENVNRLRKRLAREFAFDEETSIKVASSLIRKERTNAIKVASGKLITKVEEI